MTRLTIILLTIAAFSAASGQMLFRIGARGNETLHAYFNFSILIGLLLYGIGTTVWIYALSKETLVNVYAFTALTFVLVYLGGVFLLGEHIDLRKTIGIFLVLLGLYLITRTAGTV